MANSPVENLTFEKALADLDAVVQILEDGSASLEDSLMQYERGVTLLKFCYEKLQQTEQRIAELTGVDENGQPLFQAFEHSAAVAQEKTVGRRSRSRDGDEPG